MVSNFIANNGKFYPSMIPDNSPAGQITRLINTSANPYPVPAPTAQNELLYIIETVAARKTFSLDQHTPASWTAAYTAKGVVAWNNGGVIKYLVYGQKQINDNTYCGFVAAYNPVADSWAWDMILTDQTPSATINGICELNPAVNGQPVNNANFIIVGNFSSIASTTPIVGSLSGVVKWNSAGILQANFSKPDGTYLVEKIIDGVCSPPTGYTGDCEFVIYGSPLLINDGINPAVDYHNIAFWDKTANVYKTIGGNAADGVDAPVLCAAFQLSYAAPAARLFVGGVFTEATLQGGVEQDTKGIFCCTFTGTSPDAGVNVYLASVQPLQQKAPLPIAVNTIRNAYDPTDGVSIAGEFTSSQGVQNSLLLDNALAAQSIDSQSQPDIINLLVNKGATTDYILSGNSTPNTIYATEGGESASFGGPIIVPVQNNGITWNFAQITGGTTIAYVVVSNNNLFTGKYDAGNEMVLDFSAANLVYADDTNEHTALSAKLLQRYASLTLIGDQANNQWNLMSQVGPITYTDA